MKMLNYREVSLLLSEIPFQKKEIKNCHIAGSTESVAVLTLPVEKPQVAVPVVELILDPVEK